MPALNAKCGGLYHINKKTKITIMLETVNVVMLPTEKASRLHLVKNEFLYTSIEPFIQLDKKNYTSYHLYFTSDEEIKEDDWAIANEFNPPLLYKESKDNPGIQGDKIVATTNPELWPEITDSSDSEVVKWGKLCIPKIPTSFIEEYAKQQGKITEVILEYVGEYYADSIPFATYQSRDSYVTGTKASHSCWEKAIKLKLTSDGTVIIHHVKERIYTEKDMLEAFTAGTRRGYDQHSIMAGINTETWLKEYNKGK